MKNVKIGLLFLFTAFSLTIASSASGQWVQTNGLYGGYIKALTVCGPNLFAGTEKDGILRSTDNGLSWNPASAGLPTTVSVNAFSVSGANIYAGTLGDGVFLSTDNGIDWITLGLTDVTSLAVSGTNLIIGTGSSVDVLTDNGYKWVSSGLINTHINCLAVIGTNFFAGTSTGVFLSTDSGITWTSVDTGLTQNGKTLAVNVLASSGPYLFAAAGGGVYRSTDMGTSWFAVDTGLPSFIRITSIGVLGDNLFVGSSNYSAGSPMGAVFRSSDNGATWSEANMGIPTYTNITSFAVNDSIIFVGTESDGLFMSTDSGLSWTLTSIGLFNNSNVPALAIMSSNIFAGSKAGVFISNDTGTNWHLTGGGLNFGVTALRVNGKNIFAGTYYDSVFLSTDSGKSWIAKTNGISYGGDGGYIADFVISGSNIYARTANIGYSYVGDVYCSTDSGTSWASIDTSNITFTAFAAIGTKLFAGTVNDGVYLSTNNGATWNSAGQGLPDSLHVTALLASGSKLFAGSGRVYLSSDSGSSWVNISSNFKFYATLNSFLIVGENLFASANPGTYNVGISLTTDNGLSWKGMGLNESHYNYALAAMGGFIFAGTSSGQGGAQGILRRPLSQMLAPSTVVGRPFVAQSITSYPNPLTQSTKISFTSAESGAAEVTIVNLLGSEVARLFSGEMGAGEHSFEWDASGVAAGTYFCVVRTINGVQRVAMVVK